MKFLVRLLLNGVAILFAAWVVPGLRLAGPGAAILAGAILGLATRWCGPCSSC